MSLLPKRGNMEPVQPTWVHNVISDVVIGDRDPVFCLGWVEADGSLVETPGCKGAGSQLNERLWLLIWGTTDHNLLAGRINPFSPGAHGLAWHIFSSPFGDPDLKR